MIHHTTTDSSRESPFAALRRLALDAAIALRDCSLRLGTATRERQTCRVLMRDQALHWRDPMRPLDAR